MEHHEISEFILNIGKKIEEVSGAKLNFREEGTVPKEEWVPQKELVPGSLMLLRTAEQTQNVDVVRLKRFDPYFSNKDREIACRVPGCSEIEKFVQESHSQKKFEDVKRDLFLCEAHHEKLRRLVSKHCAEENVIVDISSFKKDDFKGYTSLISALEKAYMHLKSKWWRKSNDFLLAEFFLNTRNFLIIANALLNPNEDNTTTVLGPYLTTLLEVLEDPVKLRNGIVLSEAVVCIVFYGYRITYEWIRIPVENPGAKFGAGLGIAFALLVFNIFNFSFGKQVGHSLGFFTAGGLIGSSLYNWSLGPRFFQEQNHRLSEQLLLGNVSRAMSPNGESRQELNVQADPAGNVSLPVPVEH